MAPNLKHDFQLKSYANPYSELNKTSDSVPDLYVNQHIISANRALTLDEDLGYENKNAIIVDKSTYYRLDKYKKNSMIIFQFDDDDDSVVNNLKNTFESFSFEVEVHQSMTCEQVENIYHEYFKRDFTHYGAIAIVILGAMPWNVAFQWDSNPRMRSSFDIQNYLYNDRYTPSTLRGKPKILISQNSDIRRFSSDVPNLMDPRKGVLEVILPKTIYSLSNELERDRSCRPLNFLCEKLNTMFEKHHVIEILFLHFKESRVKWPSCYQDKLHYFPWKLTSNLKKKIYFWKSENTL